LRLATPIIAYSAAVALSWAYERDLGGLRSTILAGEPSARFVLGIALWLAAAWLAAALFERLVLRIMRRRRVENQLPKLLIDVGAILIFFAAGLVIVTHVLGQPLGGALATSGVLAAIIGFSVQRTIADVAAGVSLNLEQSIRLGDWIETASGAIGKAIEITWRTARLETLDGQMIVIPNSALSASQFINLSAPRRAMRATRKVTIDYAVPADRVVQILTAALKATDGVEPRPEPDVIVESCEASGIAYTMRFWVADYPSSFTVSSAVFTTALNFLDQAGIAPVYPKTDITLIAPRERHIDRHIDIVAILRRTPFFAAFDDDTLQLIARAGRLRDYAANSEIVREGDVGASLFVVITGLLEVTKAIAGKPPRRLGQLMPGSIFGEMSLLTGASRIATVSATTAATILEIEKSEMEPVLARYPDVMARFGQLIAEREMANESVLAAFPEERLEIARLGVAAFVRAKMARLFGTMAH